MRRFIAGLLALCIGGLATTHAIAQHPTGATVPVVALVPISTEAVADHVRNSGDAGQLPFAIVDKQAATMAVYRADGTLAGVSPVLLGRTVGDRTVPGVGERTQSGLLRPDDHITPAGRFVSNPGRNRSGEAVVWVDYEAAFAIHRLRPSTRANDRAYRLASAAAGDKRVSAGCVVVPVKFFEAVVQPVLGNSRAVVYVMPETRPWRAIWSDGVGWPEL